MNVHSLVSIIIPIYNERKNIENCLKAIKTQTYPEIEIIVVDNGSIDNSVEIVGDNADKVVYEKRRGITFAKNTGIKAAKGEFIATTDADCIPDKRWIEELIKCFNDSLIVSVGGQNSMSPDAPIFERCVDLVLRFLSNVAGSRYISNMEYIKSTFHNPGCNVMYRKSVLDELGGFNERLLTVEDEELDFRIRLKGYKILFTPFATVYHKRRSNWKDFTKQVYRYAIGRMQFMKMYFSLRQWVRFMPSFLILLSLYFLIASIFNSLFLKILLIEILMGIVGLVVTAYYLAIKIRKRSFYIFFILIFVAFWVWGIGFIRGIWYNK
jgi:cellulose synthase/poly-beta-1,6-N-acetylglucosamine synthase-like glycosyltransferase